MRCVNLQGTNKDYSVVKTLGCPRPFTGAFLYLYDPKIVL